jgi:beta-mannosidase
VAEIRCHQDRTTSVLEHGWQCLSMAPGAVVSPASLPASGWIEARLPGTVAAARRTAGLAALADAHAQDHWFRNAAVLPPGARLVCQGLATLAEIWLDDILLASSTSMFQPLEVPALPAAGRLALRFHALRPHLAGRGRGRPARWRGRLTDTEALRGVRTTMLGHMPGWHPPVPVIGPYRPIRLEQDPPDGPVAMGCDLRATLADGVGRIHLRLRGRDLAGARAELLAHGHRAQLLADGADLVGELAIPDPPLWWPHTHGTPALVPVAATLGGRRLEFGQVGFREILVRDPKRFGLVINGTDIFCRGAIWTGINPVTLPCTKEALLPALRHVRDGGLNMLRVPGFALYESQAFFDACDELGILVWHDFMFARFDYPSDAAFLDVARQEAAAFLDRTQAHPSLAVLCGGNEVMQAAAMAGRPPAEWSAPLFNEVLAGPTARLRPDVPYLPNAPYGGDLPFAADAPVTHYFGVGGYLRPPEDVLSAGVHFAAECLAFANPPDPAACRALAPVPGADPRWRDGVPRDLAASWDFEDVRDHYVRTLFGHDPAALRREAPDAWLAHGRAAIALLIETVFGAWRTDGRCAGGLMLALHDLAAGAGWGIVDHDGRPKSAWHALRRVSQRVQVLLRDHGQNGIVLHAINETASPRPVRVVLDGLDLEGAPEPLGETALTLAPRATRQVPAVALMGRWRDIGHAWRFGPPGFAVLRARLLPDDADATLSESVLFPLGPARVPRQAELAASVQPGADGQWRLSIAARRFAQFVMVDDDGCVATPNHFHLWPGETRMVTLAAHGGGAAGGSVSALNGSGAAHYRLAA